MADIKRKWDFIPKDQKRKLLDEIIYFFQKEHNLELGMIAAEDILDFFLQSAGEKIYNKGVEDSKELLRKRFADFELDLDLLLNK